MTHWLIAETDENKEFAVAKALEQLGHRVWVPCQIVTALERVSVGPGITLRRRTPKERPLLASVLLVGAEDARIKLHSLRHLNGFWTDSFEVPRLIPDEQLVIFRARVEEVNAAEIARIKKSWTAKRKPRKTVKLDPNLADELKSWLFGQREQEAA